MGFYMMSSLFVFSGSLFQFFSVEEQFWLIRTGLNQSNEISRWGRFLNIPNNIANKPNFVRDLPEIETFEIELSKDNQVGPNVIIPIYIYIY